MAVFAFSRAHVARRDIFSLHYSFYSSPLWQCRGALPCKTRFLPYFHILPGSEASTKSREKGTIKKTRRHGGYLLREPKSFPAGPLARGVSRKNTFVASCVRRPKRSRKATFEKHVFRVAPLLREAVARRSETSARASLVVFLLKKRPCARGRRRNRVVGLRALAFPLVCGRGGPRGTRRVSPPLWPSISKKRKNKNKFFS